jgi:hypothetical protein
MDNEMEIQNSLCFGVFFKFVKFPEIIHVESTKLKLRT